MAISFVGSAKSSSAANTDTTIDLSGLGLQQNDLVIVAYAIGDNDSVDQNVAMVTAGYTEVADILGDGTQDCNMGVYWKVMGASPDGSAVCDALSAGTDAAVAGVAMAFRGVDTTTPMDVTPTTATGTGTKDANPPSINHNGTAGTWTVIAGAAAHVDGAAGANSDSYTMPANYTTNSNSQGFGDTTDVTVGMGYRTNPADPEDPGVMTHSGSTTSTPGWCAVTMALREASGSPQTITATAPVVTITAPAVTLATEVAVVAGAPLVTFSAPTAIISAAGDAIIEAGAPVVTFSAPATVLFAENALEVGAPTVVFSAPAAALSAQVAMVAGAPTVVISAPTIALLTEVALALGAPVTTITAPGATLAAQVAMIAGAPVITITAPATTIEGGEGAGEAATPTAGHYFMVVESGNARRDVDEWGRLRRRGN